MVAKSKNEFESGVDTGIVLVDFFAEWCGPCKMLLPVIDDISNNWKDGKVIKVNIDEIPELAEKFDVQTIPTLVYLKDGKEVERTIGFVSKDAILAKLESLK
ncbi:MAG: thioredoxin [Mycoplasma sp.]